MDIGALLRSDPLSAYQAKGAHGEPVFRSATPLRRAVQARLGPELAGFLAIPKINERGDAIDWYAASGGDVIPPASQTEEERAQAHAEAKAMQARLREAAAGFAAAAGATRDETLFAALLAAAAEFPDGDHVYLVNGRPVITFWGFTHIGQDTTSWAARAPVATPPPEPPPAAPMPSVPAPVRRGVLSWPFLAGFLPFVVLPLLLIPLLFGLHSCSPGLVEPYVAGIDPRLPGLFGWSAPERPSPPAAPARIDPPKAEVAAPPKAEIPVVPAVEPGKPVPVTPEVGRAGTVPPVPPSKPPTPATLPPEPVPMVIPEQARKEGRVDFLEGRWRSRTGLTETDTGRPVAVDYAFDRQGQGTLTIRRDDGSECRGRAQATMRGGQLHIDGLDDPRCPDGTRFNRSQVECRVGEGGRAVCHGRHANNKTFNVEMQR
ncbi:hypothetical protein TSO221_25755 [Azospirillum sp. TSO22-1]|nr:hypothetical protein TSO221_25755 [Azospirillum sp. TSO22-1]